MDNSAVEADLKLRIEQARTWLQEVDQKGIEVRFRNREW